MSLHCRLTSPYLDAIDSGQLQALPQAELDPRRPILKPYADKAPAAMTAEQTEEGLVPYHPVLRMPSQRVPSYDQQVRVGEPVPVS